MLCVEAHAASLLDVQGGLHGDSLLEEVGVLCPGLLRLDSLLLCVIILVQRVCALYVCHLVL